MTKYRIVIAAALVLGAAVPAAAQSPILDHGSRTSAWLQVQRPSFEGSLSSWLANAGVSIAAGGGAQLLLDVPFVWVTEDGLSQNTLLGNPYVGFRAGDGKASFELGGRIPLVGSSSAWIPAAVGAAADFDNFEAYAPNLLTVAGALGYTNATKDGLVLRLRGGAAAWVPTEGHETTQWMANYMGLLGYRAGGLEVSGGFTGRYILNNAEGANFGERTIHQGVVGVTWRQGGVRPSLFVRIPLDHDASDMYNSVIGLGVSLDLR